MSLGTTTPILRIFDEAKAKEFYVAFLGFHVDWEHRFEPGLPLYMQVSKDACVLHLSEHHGDCCPGAAMRIEVSDLDAFQRRAPVEGLQVRATRDRSDAVGHAGHVRDGPVRQPADVHDPHLRLTCR